jgi:hypothetical protein
MVLLLGLETVIVGNLRENLCVDIVVIVHSTLLELQISLLRKKPDMKKRGKILKEVKVGYYKSKISENFVSKA